MTVRSYCLHCRAGPEEVAGVDCKNPSWHVDAGPESHVRTACESGDHCPCWSGDLGRCCTCRDRKL